MPKRILIWALFLVVAGALVYFLLKQPIKSTPPTPGTALPLEVQRLIPSAWSIVPGKNLTCDFDGDGENEWLVVYSYDQGDVQAPGQSKAGPVSRTLIGGVIYDAKLDLNAPVDGGQYPPTSITPYRLLPDFSSGKGQGYLGESDVKLILFPAEKDGKCSPDEIAFLGYSNGEQSLPTRLSIFRWAGEGIGYRAAYFSGNARVDVPGALDGSQSISQITTYNRLNDRSRMCESRAFQRGGDPLDMSFVEDQQAFTADFCFGAPPDPTYPEGVVVAFLRGYVPRTANKNARIPPGDNYLLDTAHLPTGLALPANIFSFTNNAAATPGADGGHSCTKEYGSAGQDWWCGRQLTEVTTEVPVAGVVRQVVWNLISVARNDVVDDVHWRVTDVGLKP